MHGFSSSKPLHAIKRLCSCAAHEVVWHSGEKCYLHSRIHEQAADICEVAHGGSSLIALPIIGTQAGVITDGQFLMEIELCLVATIGLLLEDERRHNYVHAIDQFYDHGACLQTTVFVFSFIKSACHSRILICERHIRPSNQISDISSFPVRVDSEKHNVFVFISPPGGCRSSRVHSA